MFESCTDIYSAASKGALKPICLLTCMVSKLITLKKILFFKMKEETVEAPEESEYYSYSSLL
jgi:hypothetical protein